MPGLYYSFKVVRVLWLCLLFWLVLGVQRACQLLDRAVPVAFCTAPAGPQVPAGLLLVAGPSLDRKRLAESDSSRPAHPRQWRGFRGPAYHVGAWPRPARVLRDSAGHVVTSPAAL